MPFIDERRETPDPIEIILALIISVLTGSVVALAIYEYVF